MNSFNLFSILLFLSVCISCTKNDNTIPDSVSDCMYELIEEFEENAICDSTAFVHEYAFQDKLVYLFDNGNCIIDDSQLVYAGDCELLGHINGKGGTHEINGENFNTEAKFIQVIWEN